MMRSGFDMQLEDLKAEMTTMGMLCETAISKASHALLTCDVSLAKEVPELLGRIIQKERDVETICLKLLLHQQPVAGDLRAVSSALKMVTDIQRIGTQSVDISEIVALGNICSIPEGLPVRDMATAVIGMVTNSIDAFVKQDGKIARAVIEYDDAVDALFNRMKERLVALLKQSELGGEAMVDLLMVSKYYERIGDHAENIAGWVLFSRTGELDASYFSEEPHLSEK